MVFTYIYNTFGHFRPKNRLYADNRTLIVHFFCTEVNNYIKPWIEFLKNSNNKSMYGNMTGLQKLDDGRVAIISRFSKRIGEEYYSPVFFEILKLIRILKNWENIISQKPKGILIIFGYEYETIEFVSDWKGNKYDIIAQELEKRELEDDIGLDENNIF